MSAASEVEVERRGRTSPRIAFLQDRDYQLFGVLAEARLLSLAQVRRLFFPGDTTANATARRLRRLAAGPRALLRRVDWLTRTRRETAWGLTPAGYIEAETALDGPLDVPRDDVGEAYLEHHVLLSELFVGLLEARVLRSMKSAPASKVPTHRYRGIHARAIHPGFRWQVTGDKDLPWREPQGGDVTSRVLRPDAILEFPQLRRRVFVEAEQGTHTIVSASESRLGATLSKAKRYEAYCTLLADASTRSSWYATKYPDRFAPEVLFLVRSPRRVASVEEALLPWHRESPRACGLRVATVDAALAHFRPLLGAEVDAAAPGAGSAASAAGVLQDLRKEEAAALRAFFGDPSVRRLIEGVKERREVARRAGTPESELPKYPEGWGNDLVELLKRVKRAGESNSSSRAASRPRPASGPRTSF